MSKDIVVSEEMLMSAFRYALGRRTYIVKETIDCIEANLDKLNNKWLHIMATEIRQADEQGYLGSESIDRPAWLELRRKIHAVVGKRILFQS